MSSRVIRCPSCATKNRVPDAAGGIPRCGRCGTALPWVVDAGDQTFGEVADAAALPVLVDLWAPWCGPCRLVSPVLESLATQLAGRFKLVKVNVDSSPQLASRFSAQSIPTLLLVKGGKVLARQVGAAPEAALRKWLEQGLERGTTPT